MIPPLLLILTPPLRPHPQAARKTSSSGPSGTLHAHPEKLGYEHYYVEGPGTHEWAYWNRRIQQSPARVDGKL